jgi:hypothetical protein
MPNASNRGSGTDALGTQYCYTINNYVENDVLRLRALHTVAANKVIYHAFQAEVGENGTPHLQVLMA